MHTITKRIAGVGALAFALYAVPAFAQEEAAPPVPTLYGAAAPSPVRANAPALAPAVRKQETQAAGAQSSAARKLEMERARLSASATTTSANASAREELRQKVQERVAQVRAAAEERLAKVRDRVKQQAIERVSTQFANLNATWTKHFSDMLDRLGAILQKIQSRAATDAASGKDATNVTAAIDAATAAIALAQTAVNEQAAKTYAPDVSSAAPAATATTTAADAQIVKEFRNAFSALHATLFSDLKTLRDGPMADARKAVQAALQALQQAEAPAQESAGGTGQ